MRARNEDLATPYPARWFSIALSAFAIFAATNGPTILLAVHILHQPINLDDWHFTYAIALIGAIGVVRLSAAWSTGWRPTWPLSAVALLALWILLSATWSVESLITAHRALLTVCVLVFAISFAMQSVEHQVIAIALGANLASAMSLVAVVGFPSVGKALAGVGGPGDFFQGIFANRNSLGPVCVLAVFGLVGVALLRSTLVWWIVAALGGAMNLWLLWGTRSVTGVIAIVVGAFVGLAAIGTQRLARRVPVRRAGSIAVIALVAAVTLLARLRNKVFDLMGRDASLSGRRQIWTDVLEVVNRRPFQGYGFWVFWDSDRVWEVYNKHGGYQFGSAHNSVVEAALGLGWVGAALFVGIILIGVAGLVRWNLVNPSPIAAWWASLFAALVVENMTESFLHFHSYVLILLASTSMVPWLIGTRKLQ